MDLSRSGKGARSSLYYDQGRCQFFLKTRKAQEATAGENDAAIPPPTEPPQKKRNGPAKKDAESDGDGGDGSDDSEEEDDGKGLLKEKWTDEEPDAECTVTRRTSFHVGSRPCGARVWTKMVVLKKKRVA